MNSDFFDRKSLNRRFFMKRLSTALILGFVILPFCFAQQSGNASYNPSKPGFFISHPSISFNGRVRITNLRNNRSVEAVVNGRIPISSERIADISQDAGDALGMDKNGLTLVLIEELPSRRDEPASVKTPNTTPQPGVPPRPGPAPASTGSQPGSPSVITQILPLQTITEYVEVPASAQPYCSAALLVAILVLLILILAIAILVVILVLMLRRFPLWPWYYPFWLRRRYQWLKKRLKKRRRSGSRHR
jgi:hypothetical protein